MQVAMVKHTSTGKVFWFEVPAHLSGAITPGVRVICETSRGKRAGVAVSTPLNPADVKDVMAASGVTTPIRPILNVAQTVFLDNIIVPEYLTRSHPSDEKIAKRFLEFYHTGDFQTNIVVDANCKLVDGYTAYLVAQKVGLSYLSAIVREEE